MKMIVGLGNPGRKYQKTRHNIGFMMVDIFLPEAKWQKKFNALFFEKNIGKDKVIFVKPQTYMNESGETVKLFADYFKINEQDILVIHDDLDLEIGKYKIKKDSSSGGHNGIKSIIDYMKSDNFCRLKIGISNDKSIETKNYVLAKFSKEEKELIDNNVQVYCNIISSFIINGFEYTINNYSKK